MTGGGRRRYEVRARQTPSKVVQWVMIREMSSTGRLVNRVKEVSVFWGSKVLSGSGSEGCNGLYGEGIIGISM